MGMRTKALSAKQKLKRAISKHKAKKSVKAHKRARKEMDTRIEAAKRLTSSRTRSTGFKGQGASTLLGKGRKIPGHPDKTRRTNPKAGTTKATRYLKKTGKRT